MSRRLFSLPIFWLASTVPPISLESNLAGDFHLIESGFYGMDDFSGDLSKWTIDEGLLGTDIIHSAAEGGHLEFKAALKIMRYTATPVSPTLLLPNTTIQCAALETWYPLGGADDRDALLARVGGPVSGPADGLPWETDGWGSLCANKVWFATGWTHGYYQQGSTNFAQWNPFGWVDSDPTNPSWLGQRWEPDGAGFSPPRNCSGGIDAIHVGCGHSSGDWVQGVCTGANRDLAGWPAIQSTSAGTGLSQSFKIFEIHIWKHASIRIIGVPEDHYVKAVMVAGTPTSHPTYTLPARDRDSGQGQAVGTPDECGYTLDYRIYDSPTTPPRFQTVQLWESVSGGPDVLLTEISPTSFQPGVYGGDIYSYCDVIQGQGLCVPLSAISYFFFGGGLAPTFRQRARTKLDAVLAEFAPSKLSVKLDAVLLGTIPTSGLIVDLNADSIVASDDTDISSWPNDGSLGDFATVSGQGDPRFFDETNGEFNGHSYVSFNEIATDEIMELASVTDFDDMTVFVVAERSSGRDTGHMSLVHFYTSDAVRGGVYFSRDDGSDPPAWWDNVNTWKEAWDTWAGRQSDHPYVCGYRLEDQVAVEFYQDDRFIGSQSIASTIPAFDTIFVGGTTPTAGRHDGKIARVLIYNNKLSDDDRDTVLAILNNLYLPRNLSTGKIIDLNADSYVGSDGEDITTMPNDGSLGDFTGVTGAKPTYETNEVNGHAIMRFAGAEKLELTSGVSALDGKTVIAAVKKTANTGVNQCLAMLWESDSLDWGAFLRRSGDDSLSVWTNGTGAGGWAQFNSGIQGASGEIDAPLNEYIIFAVQAHPGGLEGDIYWKRVRDSEIDDHAGDLVAYVGNYTPTEWRVGFGAQSETEFAEMDLYRLTVWDRMLSFPEVEGHVAALKTALAIT